MALTPRDFYSQLRALLPFGPAWEFADESQDGQQLQGLAVEPSRIMQRLNQLVDEADPRTTYELLPDLERVFGLPTDCMQGVDQTLEQRRAALHAQMISTGGQSKAYFVGIAAAAGYSITITEYRPSDVGMSVDDEILGDDWAYTWQVNAPLSTISEFTFDSGVDEAISSWGNEQLECLIKRFKPAHTIVLFSYS